MPPHTESGDWERDGILTRRRTLQFAGVGITLPGLSQTVGGQEGFVDIIGTDPSSYPTIQLNVQVDTEAGRDGRLSKEDFTVFENGEKRELTGFEFSSTQLDLVFVFDDTGSMGDEIAGAKAQSKELTQQIADSGIDAHYGLVSFKDNVDVDLPLTDDASKLERAIEELTADGGGDGPEDNFDAIEQALEFDLREGAQKVFIDITDNISHYRGDGTNISEYTLPEVKTDLMEAGVTYVAVSPGFDDEKASKKNLAEEVGGLYVDIDGGDFDKILREITETLVETYFVRYETTRAPGSDLPIGVDVIDPNRGEGSASGSLKIPEEVRSPLDVARENKVDITSEVDRLAVSIDEQSRVVPTLNGLQSAVEAGSVEEDTAVEAIERMVLVEDLAELSLAGLSSREAIEQKEGSFAGEPPESVGVDPSKNVLGTTGGLVIEAILSLTSMVSTISEYVTKLGENFPIVDELLKAAGKAAEIIKKILALNGVAELFIEPLIDKIWENIIKDQLLDGEYESAEELYADIEEETDQIEDTISDIMMRGYESGDDRSNALDDTLEQVDSELSTGGDGPTFGGGTADGGPVEDASSAADSARDKISDVITVAQDRLDNNEWIGILLNIIELSIILGAGAAAFTGGLSLLVPKAISLIFGLPALVIVLIGIKRGLDAGDDVLDIVDEAAKSIVEGEAEVSL